MHTFFGSGIGRKACPSSSWRERSEELIDRVRQIEHAEPSAIAIRSIDLARDAVDSPQGKRAWKSDRKTSRHIETTSLVQAGRSAAKAAPVRSGLHSGTSIR
jgi:hypothetical protein